MPQPLPQPDASLPQGDITADVSPRDAVAADAPVVRSAQQGDSDSNHVSDYGHDEAMADIFDLAHIETEFEGHNPRVTSLAAYIERLEAERVSASAAWGERDEYEQMYLKEKAKAEWLAIQLEHRSADLWEAWLLSAEEATR
jgi:hypothetical protein